jgi:hypothetical protein
MTINNPELYNDGFWDWAILDGCFGDTKIKPTDIDGCVERRGKVLFIETKHPGAKIPDGQKYTFQTLVGTGIASVLVVWGNRDQPEAIMEFHKNITRGPYPADIEKLRERISRWYKWADGSN